MLNIHVRCQDGCGPIAISPFIYGTQMPQKILFRKRFYSKTLVKNIPNIPILSKISQAFILFLCVFFMGPYLHPPRDLPPQNPATNRWKEFLHLFELSSCSFIIRFQTQDLAAGNVDRMGRSPPPVCHGRLKSENTTKTKKTMPGSY